ncbi:MAG: AAA family ATPase [Acidobacteriota bacterium]
MAKVIQVCGDPTVDWMSIQKDDFVASGGAYFWLSDQSVPHVSLSSQPGGSALLLELLEKMIPDNLARVEGKHLDPRLLNEPKNAPINTSWTMWKAYIKDKEVAFRLSELREFESGNWDYTGNKLKGKADLLIIEDSGLGFRECEEGWPEVLDNEKNKGKLQHIILKLAQFSDQERINPLIKRITDLGYAKNTTILTSVYDLRAAEVRIGTSLSWEKIMEEIVAAVHSQECPFVDKAGKLIFNQVIVSIGASGAVIVDDNKNVLIFDQNGQEDDFARHFPGRMMGSNTCVMSALAMAWSESPSLDCIDAVRIGVGLARHLHFIGYKVIDDQGHRHLHFPIDDIVRKYWEVKDRNALPKDPNKTWNLGLYIDSNDLVLDKKKRGRWTILEESINHSSNNEKDRTAADVVCDVARKIVLEGPQTALPSAPIESVGNWRSADRNEIEGVRSVNNAFREYLELKNPDKPLCVAVFGPPGAGKSFAIKEIAKGLGIDKDAQLTFNMSQFESPQELANAFHQIRDLHLKGKMPLVFWDEFDTPCEGRPLGWLRYFLAPMQDGEFTEQGRVHPLGGGIYVFAGATRPSFAAFVAGSSQADLEAKKPDYVSRLKAYIDVRGPNGNPNPVEDCMHVIRRAFLFNTYLETNAPQTKKAGKFQINRGIINAFLQISRYRHGARSMETLVKMSSLSSKKKYELSSLPPDHIVDMHVNAEEFGMLTRIGHLDSLRIAVAGHVNLDLNKLEDLNKGILKAIGFVIKQYPERVFTVFSPLAEGADRLLTQELLKLEGSRLVAVLPLPVEDYANVFGPNDDPSPDIADYLQELRHWVDHIAREVIVMSRKGRRNEAYRDAGWFCADNCDVLITVWDGQEDQALGGTASVVNRVLAQDKPVCHVWANNNKVEVKDSLNAKANLGKVRHINFPGSVKGKWIEK